MGRACCAFETTFLAVTDMDPCDEQVGGHYRGENKGLFVLLSKTQAGPGRTVKQEQEEISRNHAQTFIFPSVQKNTLCPPKISQT